MKLSLIVPCYNEEGNILPLYNKVKETFSGKLSSYEFVFINDGSYDHTGAVLAGLVQKADTPVKVVNFSRNFGKESGIYAGLHYAGGEYICIMDGDLQQSPEFLLEMTDYLDRHPDCDCVAAYQENRNENPGLVFLKENFYKIINRISDTEFRSDASDFRTFRRNVAETILNMPEYHRFSKGIFSWVGFNTHYIPYQADERLTGTSKWSFLKLWKYAFEGIIAFSTKPLELPFWGGLALSGASLVPLAAAKKESSKTNALIALVGGLNMTAVGIGCIYLSKTYLQVKNRPVYIVKSVLTNEGTRKK